MLRLLVVGILMFLSGCASTKGIAVNNIHISYSQGEHTISTSLSLSQQTK